MKDPHSFSDFQSVTISHLDWTADLDFDRQVIRATAELTIVQHRPSDSLILDTRGLNVSEVLIAEKPVPFSLGEPDPILGQALRIAIDKETKQVRIRYETSPDAAALQWLGPQQTMGKKSPFLFTQSQAILARTWIPLQDGPQVRFTYTARVKAPAGLRVLMSASQSESTDSAGYWNFRMDQPIPSYLMALAAGDLTFRRISDRSGIYAEPEFAETVVREFEDTEKMIQAAESLYGPYQWGRYDILVLPPSFPFGGMENPRLTFATPTVIAGDKSLVALVAHELAHSWSGNLVTNALWDDFWLNEGFTVYFEGRIMEAVYGPDFAIMEQSLGFNGLKESVAAFGLTHPDTHLKLNLTGRDPDDGVSDIAYEKGANFLRVIERTVGREAFDAFLGKWFTQHQFTSVTTDQFLSFLQDELLINYPGSVDTIRIQDWVFGPGIPSNAIQYQSVRLSKVEDQANAWAAGTPASRLSVAGWTTPEWLYFLRKLPHDSKSGRMAELDAAFQFSRSGNAEILAEWLGHTIDMNYLVARPVLEKFLMQVGRRKFLRPLYEKLAATPAGLTWARKVYAVARPGYHSVSTSTIDEILKVHSGV